MANFSFKDNDDEITILGRVNRSLPYPTNDGTIGDTRLTRYKEQYVVSSIQTKHPLVDEGSYFIASQASNVNGAIATNPTATAPYLVLTNTANVSDNSAKRIHLDYIEFKLSS